MHHGRARRAWWVAIAGCVALASSGCTERERMIFGWVVIGLLVLALLIGLVFVVTLIVGTVRLVQGKPSATLGVTGIVMGTLLVLPSISNMMEVGDPGAVFTGLGFGAALLAMGILNVVQYRKLRANQATTSYGPYPPYPHYPGAPYPPPPYGPPQAHWYPPPYGAHPPQHAPAMEKVDPGKD